MVTLKELAKNDLDLFFNTDEFAEDAQINEHPCKVIIKSKALKELKLKMGESLEKAEILFTVRKTELPGKPKVKSTLKFNGSRYEIMACSENDFEYEVLLGANR